MPRIQKSIVRAEASEMTPKNRTLPVVFVLATLLILSMGIAGYFYYQYRNTSAVKDTKEVQELAETIGQFMELPQNEAPTLATVTDKEKLAEQAFFQKAENGDKVLIYSSNGRAILYRPSTKKIIDVTTVNVNTPADDVTATAEPPVPAPITAPAEEAPLIVRAVLYNGSTTVGVTNRIESELKPLYSNVAVVAKESAKKKDYEKTLAIDLTGRNAEIVSKIAQTLQGEVGELPADEVAPAEADILIIVGKQ